MQLGAAGPAAPAQHAPCSRHRCRRQLPLSVADGRLATLPTILAGPIRPLFACQRAGRALQRHIMLRRSPAPLWPAGMLLLAVPRPAAAQLTLSWTAATSVPNGYSNIAITAIAFFDATTVVAVGAVPSPGTTPTLLVSGGSTSRRQHQPGACTSRQPAPDSPPCRHAAIHRWRVDLVGEHNNGAASGHYLRGRCAGEHHRGLGGGRSFWRENGKWGWGAWGQGCPAG